MKKVEPWRGWMFIGVLGMVAFVINRTEDSSPNSDQQVSYAYRPRNESIPRTEKPTNNTQPLVSNITSREDPMVVKKRFQAMYLRASSNQTQNAPILAIAAVSENGELDRSLARMLVERFENHSIKTSVSLFSKKFAEDGLFRKLFNGSDEILNELDLAKRASLLLLAKRTVEYSNNPSLENVISANLTLELKLLRTQNPDESETKIYTSVGAGFKNENALLQAEERLAKKIQKETNLFSNFFKPKNL